MKSIGDYLPIIIGIFAFLYSMSSAARKAKQQQAKKTPPVNEPKNISQEPKQKEDDLKKILEEILTRKSVQEPKTLAEKQNKAKPSHVPLQKKTQMKKSHLPELHKKQLQKSRMPARKTKEEGKEIFLTETKPGTEEKRSTMQLPEEHPANLHPQNFTDDQAPADFDLRQAVLFSEILKRPEY